MAFHHEGSMKKNTTIRRSPFFYVGDKFKLICKIKHLFPEKIDTLVEPFLGGGSVFLNVDAKRYSLNDINKDVIALHNFLTSNSGNEKRFLQQVKKIVTKYDLSRSVFEDVVPMSLRKKWLKTYYAEYNRKGYTMLRTEYNNSKKKDPLLLYLLLIYGFNRILRFNKKGEFNVPVGNVDFNRNVAKALNDYFSVTKDKKISFHNEDFKTFLNSQKLKKHDFVYVDPPYLISASEYNKLWGTEQEEALLNILDTLDKKGIKFALSNITTYNGKKNEKLIIWMKRYKVHKVDSNYISYHNNAKKQITEVLVTNY